MQTSFEEFNLLIYNVVRGTACDAVIWGLGPYVDDSREYGVFRLYLAAFTRRLCRRWLRVED